MLDEQRRYEGRCEAELDDLQEFVAHALTAFFTVEELRQLVAEIEAGLRQKN
jgi:hypothetical protein